MRYSVLFVFIFLLFNACQSSENSKPPYNKADIKESEIDLQALYKNYHSKLTSQADIDENKIIEYIANNQLITERKDNGVYIVTHKEGSGEFLTGDEVIQAHYKGYLLNGKEFDNSYKRGKPISFRVGQMIEGWNDTMQYLKHGSKVTLLIPSHLGYGRQGYKDLIPEMSVLVFEMEIL